MNKIKSLSDIYLLRNNLPESLIVVLATGVFDLLHREHRNYLKAARDCGNLLFVGVETDHRVRQLKGKDRPVQNQNLRLANLANLPFVDYLFLLPETLDSSIGRDEFISRLHPQIYAVSQHSPNQSEKRRLLRKYHGRLEVVLPRNPAISTTQIIANRNPAKSCLVQPALTGVIRKKKE